MIFTDLGPVEYLCKDQTIGSLLQRAWWEGHVIMRMFSHP